MRGGEQHVGADHGGRAAAAGDPGRLGEAHCRQYRVAINAGHDFGLRAMLGGDGGALDAERRARLTRARGRAGGGEEGSSAEISREWVHGRLLSPSLTTALSNVAKKDYLAELWAEGYGRRRRPDGCNQLRMTRRCPT